MIDLDVHTEVLGEVVQALEDAIIAAEDCRNTLLEAVGTTNPIGAFKKAVASGAIAELTAYVSALTELKPLTDHQDGGRTITARKAQAILNDATRRLARLKSQLNKKHAQKNITAPLPQVGTRYSIRTISGGLPTLGRRHR